jgi:pyridoxine kinase
VLPSAVLSTHTGGFTGFTFRDLTEDMPGINAHWQKEGIKFDAVYTGYLGSAKQIAYVKDIVATSKKENAPFIVDPAMADHGKLYPALSVEIVEGMKKICGCADYVIPNITEACFLTDTPYQEEQSEEFINELLEKLIKTGAKNVILTSVSCGNKIGATYYNGKERVTVLKPIEEKSYHGTGDLFSSLVIAGIMNKKDIKENLEFATDFIIESILATVDDPNHNYAVKYEDVLNKKWAK